MSALLPIDVLEHVQRADGTRELILLVRDADLEMLAAIGDEGPAIAEHQHGVTAAWTWGPTMVPADPVAVCTRYLEVVLYAWAMAWAGVDAMDLTA